MCPTTSGVSYVEEKGTERVQYSGKMASLVHSLLTFACEQPGCRIQVVVHDRQAMEHLLRVIYLSAFPLAIQDYSFEEQGFILFENGSEIHFSFDEEDKHE